MLVYVIDQDKTYRLVQRGNPPVNTSTGPVQQPTQIGVHWVEAQFGGVCKRGAGQWSVVCLGSGNSANGPGSTAMGFQTQANGQYSTAMGYQTQASGHYSTAMGWWTQASGDFSTAMGWWTQASGDFSTAMGRTAKANHN
jgi:hypothetical protein